MRNQLTLDRDQHGTPGPRGLRVVENGSDRRFGTIHYGESADKQAAGVWGDGIPLAFMPERAGELASYRTSLDPAITVEVDGEAGRLHQPLGFSILQIVGSRKRRAVHVDFPSRNYRYYLRWLHMRVERDGAGEVVRRKAEAFRITGRADAVDAAVGLLVARVVGENYISIFNETSEDPAGQSWQASDEGYDEGD